MFNTILGTEMTVQIIAICTMVSLVSGAILALTYMKTGRYSQNFPITVLLLPAVVQMIIMLVNGNLGVGVAVAGAFSLVRFRSLPGSSKEILTVFFAMAIGIATGMGYVAFGAIFTILISIIFLALYKLNFAKAKNSERTIRITVPEELDFEGVFDEIFETYARNYELDRIKTTNMGSMFELSYKVDLKSLENLKSLLDDIRARNANLPIIISKIDVEKAVEL